MDETEVDFRQLFEALPGRYLVLSPSLRILAATDAYLAASMTDRAAIVGRQIFDVFPDNPADATADGVGNLSASLDRVIRERRTDAMAVQKYDIRRPDGTFEVRHWSPVNHPVFFTGFGADGAVRYVLHQVEDVTEYILASASRAETEALRERTVRMEAEIVTRARQLQDANVELRRAREELERRVEERTAALRVTEEQLRHSQKMEAVGRLAGGVAHDFNNMLSVILSYADLVQSGFAPTDPRAEDLEQVKLAATRAAGLTAQLLAFSRQQVLQPRLLSVDGVVVDLEKMLRRLLGEDIDLSTGLRSDGAQVFADQGQLEQVIANLAVNARDAMPSGGRLTIETAVVDLDEDYARVHLGATPGRYVLLAVSDTGCGIPDDVRARMFEPFFTTKEVGKGTGLGLSTVYGIVRQSGGTIWVYSEVGHGTTFKVYLPLAGTGRPAAPVPRSAGAIRPGSETVLVVEDEELVRTAIVGILERRGYRVLTARSGAEALRTVAGLAEPVHLLLTDVVMPGMSGRTLSEQLTLARPGLRTLFMSGYTDDAVVRNGVLGAERPFVQKPFTPDGLARKVREVLDG
ncbi:MAG: ATP-binding protein [Myxococcota bacterium]